MKADLKYYGPIGFQDYWLKRQGYTGKNLLELIANACFTNGLDVCAITSHREEIPRMSIDDRFGQLKNNYGLSLPSEYETDTLGKNILIVRKGEKKVHLVNSQVVMTKDGDYLVFGTNEIPTQQGFEWTIKHVHGREKILGGLLRKRENIEGPVRYIDFVVGHDSQAILPTIFEKVPLMRKYTRKSNQEAQELAREDYLPWVAVSNGHLIEKAGLSYIEFSPEHLDTKNEDRFFESFKRMFNTPYSFTPKCNDEKRMDFARWFLKFAWAIKVHRKFYHDDV